MSETRIRYFEDDEVTGDLKAVYDRWLTANPEREQFPAILKCFGASGDAQVLKGLLSFCYSLQFAPGRLGRRLKEMIASYVSALNQCPY